MHVARAKGPTSTGPRPERPVSLPGTVLQYSQGYIVQGCVYISPDHHQLVDAVLLEGLIVAPLTSSPIRADRLWAQKRE